MYQKPGHVAFSLAFWALFAWLYRKTPNNARAVPKAFCRLTGTLNAMTEATITTTRLIQFPIECVTGDTLWSTRYEICWYEWKDTLAMMALTSIPSGSDWMTAGVTWTPSTRIAIGAKIRNDMIVKMLNKLMLSRPSFPAACKHVWANATTRMYIYLLYKIPRTLEHELFGKDISRLKCDIWS